MYSVAGLEKTASSSLPQNQLCSLCFHNIILTKSPVPALSLVCADCGPQSECAVQNPVSAQSALLLNQGNSPWNKSLPNGHGFRLAAWFQALTLDVGLFVWLFPLKALCSSCSSCEGMGGREAEPRLVNTAPYNCYVQVSITTDTEV